ncbi:MAG: metallophosphoesterase [Candidatus Odinarchaeota archaeon]
MIIAVMSDTHDHMNNISKAVSIINKRNVEALIHCGDYVAPFVKRPFDELNDAIKKKFYGVFGNNDGDKLLLKKNLGQICEFPQNGHELILELGDKRIFVSHMPREKTIKALANSGNFDIILSGHTHSLSNIKLDNGTLVLNPGELCGYLTGNATFAILDTEKMESEIINL